MAEVLRESSITHGGILPVVHPRLNVQVCGETAIRYLRFMRPVRVDGLELPFIVYGRWIPRVPTHPAHITVSVLDRETYRWRKVRDVEFPPDPRIAGEDLSQRMTVDEMDAHLVKVLEAPPHLIDLGGIETDHLRVECDREHPVWPNHGECAGAPHTVPFGILNALRALGQCDREDIPRTPYCPPLRVGEIRPGAPKGMVVSDRPEMLLFTGKRLAVGFSLRRPLLMHLGWDALGKGKAAQNRLAILRLHRAAGAASGPVTRTLTLDCMPWLWTGEVSVYGNRIVYRHLRSALGVVLDATFTVEPDGLIVELTQTCEHDVPVLEAEGWRLVFNLRAGITGAMALPTLLPGRNGDVHLPLLWASDGVGALTCRVLEHSKETPRMQVESYRPQSCVMGGFVLSQRADAESCEVITAGTRRAVFELAVANLEPQRRRGAARPSEGIRRHWATVFSCFRPEFRGFSNHSASINCHLSQGAPIEVVVHTRRPKVGPDPLALARFTLERAILDGGGYGYWRNLYLDSDPVLVSAAGRVYQADPNLPWLRRIEPGLRESVERMAAAIGTEGLVVCRALSGDSGSYRWSSNGMDVVGFGHFDAYVNAWCYRAFRNAEALFAQLRQDGMSGRCRGFAEGIRGAYAPQLVNPETGWVAGWRSHDGQLHDYAFLWVNGVALAFGLLDKPAARRALQALERLRDEAGPGSARLGLPCNLLPIREEDHMLSRIVGGTEPTFETYTDGSLSGWPATYYLRALSIYGLKTQARRLAKEMADGYAAGIFNGGMGTGHEFRSWEGMATGYEGTLIGCFGPLYAIAIEQGLFEPPEPEWWPAVG